MEISGIEIIIIEGPNLLISQGRGWPREFPLTQKIDGSELPREKNDKKDSLNIFLRF